MDNYSKARIINLKNSRCVIELKNSRLGLFFSRDYPLVELWIYKGPSIIAEERGISKQRKFKKRQLMEIKGKRAESEGKKK